jgi:hypothetical protein
MRNSFTRRNNISKFEVFQKQDFRMSIRIYTHMEIDKIAEKMDYSVS